jgi:hypothetical protein
MPVPGGADVVGGAVVAGGEPVRDGGAANAGVEVSNSASVDAAHTSSVAKEGRRVEEPNEPII